MTAPGGDVGDPPTAGSVRGIEGHGFEITFHGVRGSTPCHGEEIARYGGNTSCVSVAIDGVPPILFDMGTGARYFGIDWPDDVPFDGICLLSHLHWDHVQGLPFFPPLLREGSRLEIHAPAQGAGTTVSEVFDGCLCPPLFPVGLDAFPAKVEFIAHTDDAFPVGAAEVMTRLIPHIGPTLGYRVTHAGRSVAYLSDHQQPGVDVYAATDNALELCRGVDVLIHDAQYTREEFVPKATWGHCTIEYAMWLAERCGVGTLVLFHHDPSHDDDQIDRLVADADARLDGVRVLAAHEGLTIRLGA